MRVSTVGAPVARRRCRAAREDDRARGHGADLLEGHRAGVDLAVDALLADAAGDELRVLRAEVEDEDELASRHVWLTKYQPGVGRQGMGLRRRISQASQSDAAGSRDGWRRLQWLRLARRGAIMSASWSPICASRWRSSGPSPCPCRATRRTGAAGMDLHAALAEALVVPPLGRVRVPTGLVVRDPGLVRGAGAAAVGAGVEDGAHRAQRSGHDRQRLPRRGAGAAREPERRAGRPSQPLERIAQLVIAPVARAELVVVAELDATARGAGGLGSTGST